MTARIIPLRPRPIDPIRIETEQPMPPAPSFWLWLIIVAPVWGIAWWWV